MKWITLTLAALFLFLQYQIWFAQGGLHSQYAQVSQQARQLEKQNSYLRQNNALLRAEVQDLKNGYDAAAEIARHDMGLIENGETYYQLRKD